MSYLSADKLAHIRNMGQFARSKYCANCQQDTPHILPWAWPPLRNGIGHGRACLICGWQHVHKPVKSKRLRHAVYEVDNNQCVYCGRSDRLGLDHIVPQAHGGKSTFDNLLTACHWCNTLKQEGRRLLTPRYGRFAGSVQ